MDIFRPRMSQVALWLGSMAATIIRAGRRLLKTEPPAGGQDPPVLDAVDPAEERRRARARAWVASGFRTTAEPAADSSDGTEDDILGIGGPGSADSLFEENQL